MSDLQLDILDATLANESDFGSPTFTWLSGSYICIPNTLHNKEKSNDAGFSKDADFRMKVRLNQFSGSNYPALNDYIYFNGNRLLVKQINMLWHNVFAVYEMELPNIN